MDMATALSGTGPAYVFIFMEALIDAGVHIGLPRHLAEKMVVATLRGSVRYYEVAQKSIATLRHEVTSPGGTTAEAMYRLEKAGFRPALSRAVWAAYQRALSLSPDTAEGDR
jgi:pyrroline-5-carboxylate reductase